MFRKYIAIFVVALAVLLAGQADAKGKKGGGLTTVQGTVYAVDVSGGTVTLQSSDGALTSLNVVRNSKLKRNNKKVTLMGLVLGDRATAQYDASSNTKQLSATGAVVSTLSGDVVGVKSGTGVVQLDRGSFGTNAHTRIIRNGEVTTLGTLTARDRVVAHVKQGGSSSHGSQSSSESEGDDDTAIDVTVDGPEECEVEGNITEIDLDANTVTIASEYDDWGVTVNITPDTIIEIEGFEMPTIADLAVGQYVEVVYASDTQDAFRIEVENEEEEGYAEGPITAIDPVAGTVTFDCYGSPVTLFVTASTKIEKNDEVAGFGDLQVGDEGMAEYNTTTMIAKEIEVESPEDED
ncbi:MAG TPA: DUF5666 domain-containing protein [Candidatus Binatia bacterium]|jgi:predicted RNA-binding protein